MADFPGAVYTPRTKENRTGVTYDASKSKVLFAEDVTKLDDEVVAVETELGVNPRGSYADVAARLAAIEGNEIYNFGSPSRCLRMKIASADTAGGCPVWAAPNGDFYVVGFVALGSGSGYGMLGVFRSTDGGVVWSLVGDYIRPANTPIFSSLQYPVICVDSAGNIGVSYLAYNSDVGAVVNINFVFWDGNSWSAVQQVSSIATAGYDVATYDMSIDSDDCFHVAWAQKGADSTTSARLRYRKRSAGSGGTWAAKVDLDDANGNASMVHIVCDSADHPRIIFRDGGNSNYISIATDASGSWVTTASNNNGSIYSIVISSADTIYIQLGSTTTVYFDATPTFGTLGAIWSVFTNIYQIAIDTSDDLFSWKESSFSHNQWRVSAKYDVGSSTLASTFKVFNNDLSAVGPCTMGVVFKQRLASPKVLVWGPAGIHRVVDLY